MFLYKSNKNILIFLFLNPIQIIIKDMEVAGKEGKRNQLYMFPYFTELAGFLSTESGRNQSTVLSEVDGWCNWLGIRNFKPSIVGWIRRVVGKRGSPVYCEKTGELLPYPSPLNHYVMGKKLQHSLKLFKIFF